MRKHTPPLPLALILLGAGACALVAALVGVDAFDPPTQECTTPEFSKLGGGAAAAHDTPSPPLDEPAPAEADLPSSFSPSVSSSSSLSSSSVPPSSSSSFPLSSSLLQRPKDSPGGVHAELLANRSMSKEDLLARARAISEAEDAGLREHELGAVHYNHYIELNPSDSLVRKEAEGKLSALFRLLSATSASPGITLTLEDATRPVLLQSLVALKAGGHVQRLHNSFKLFRVDDFLTIEESQGLVMIHDRAIAQYGSRKPLICSRAGGFQTVTEQDYMRGVSCLKKPSTHTFTSNLKWSNVTTIYKHDYVLTDSIMARLRSLLNLTSETVSFTIESYGPGWQQPAVTACSSDDDSSPTKPTAITLTAFLNADLTHSGGSLSFPDLRLSIPRVTGALIASFNYDSRGRCEVQGAQGLEAVVGLGRAVNLVVKIDNMASVERGLRVFGTVPSPVQGKRPYQPIVMCAEREKACRCYYDAPSTIRQAMRFA